MCLVVRDQDLARRDGQAVHNTGYHRSVHIPGQRLLRPAIRAEQGCERGIVQNRSHLVRDARRCAGCRDEAADRVMPSIARQRWRML